MSASALVLDPGDRQTLERLAASSSVATGVSRRARIVLLAADGFANAQIARVVGVSRPTVVNWRARYMQAGIDGLWDRVRSGRPAWIDDVAVVAETLRPPPARLGAAQWSARLLADHLGISYATVARIWRQSSLKPELHQTITRPADSTLAEPAADADEYWA